MKTRVKHGESCFSCLVITSRWSSRSSALATRWHLDTWRVNICITCKKMQKKIRKTHTYDLSILVSYLSFTPSLYFSMFCGLLYLGMGSRTIDRTNTAQELFSRHDSTGIVAVSLCQKLPVLLTPLPIKQIFPLQTSPNPIIFGFIIHLPFGK